MPELHTCQPSRIFQLQIDVLSRNSKGQEGPWRMCKTLHAGLLQYTGTTAMMICWTLSIFSLSTNAGYMLDLGYCPESFIYKLSYFPEGTFELGVNKLPNWCPHQLEFHVPFACTNSYFYSSVPHTMLHCGILYLVILLAQLLLIVLLCITYIHNSFPLFVIYVLSYGCTFFISFCYLCILCILKCIKKKNFFSVCDPLMKWWQVLFLDNLTW